MSVAWFLVAIVALVAAGLYLSRFLMKRALREVVSRFYERGAIEAKSAATLQELDLVPPSLLERMSRLRDYRPHAVSLLVKAEIVRATEGGRLYLSEDALKRSNLRYLAPPKTPVSPT